MALGPLLCPGGEDRTTPAPVTPPPGWPRAALARQPPQTPWAVRRLVRVPGQVAAHPTVPEFPVSPSPPLLPKVAPKAASDPGIQLLEDGRGFRVAKVSVPPRAYRRTSCTTWGNDTPRVRCVSRRISCLNVLSAFALPWRRFGWRAVKLKPKNARRHGRSTALLAALTASFSLPFKDRVPLARTRAPARALLTSMWPSSA